MKVKGGTVRFGLTLVAAGSLIAGCSSDNPEAGPTTTPITVSAPASTEPTLPPETDLPELSGLHARDFRDALNSEPMTMGFGPFDMCSATVGSEPAGDFGYNQNSTKILMTLSTVAVASTIDNDVFLSIAQFDIDDDLRLLEEDEVFIANEELLHGLPGGSPYVPTTQLLGSPFTASAGDLAMTAYLGAPQGPQGGGNFVRVLESCVGSI